MKIAYKHIISHLTSKPSIEEISSKLFQLGHEHEIENSIFNIEFTPNRGDCLSVLGLLRDLNVFYDNKFSYEIFEDPIPPFDINFENKAKESCTDISFLNIVIDNEVEQYASYLDDYFQTFNLNKNNFFTDVSNYLAYELGQPTHCYDFNQISNNITLQPNKGSNYFNTLINQEILIEDSDLIFTSSDKIINLAGVMGGNNSACKNTTTNVLIECAHFSPESIIGKSVKYNLNSEASYKFERGTDSTCHEKVLRRFIKIIEDHTKIKKMGLYKNSSSQKKLIALDFDVNQVNSILGTNISEAEYKKYLARLGFKVEKSIFIPPYRNDISNQNDLAEEIARAIGYDNIKVGSLKIGLNNKPNNEKAHDGAIKDFLIKNGFTEVINLPFCSDSREDSIKIDNPLDKNKKFFRRDIANSLIENLLYNEKRQKDSIKIFEISDIYTFDNSGAIKIDKKLGILISGRQGHDHHTFSKKLDKKYLISLFNQVKFNIHDYISVIDRSSIKSKVKTPVFVAELMIKDFKENFSDYEQSKEKLNYFVKYKPISDFPSSYRDLSFSVKDSMKIETVINFLKEIKSEIIKESFMFDFYENKLKNETKIGYRFIFNSSEKTLTDKEIDFEIDKIINKVLKIKSVSLPGNKQS
jgi:phenylalanyl-tRNA synthetase beta chain